MQKCQFYNFRQVDVCDMVLGKYLRALTHPSILSVIFPPPAQGQPCLILGETIQYPDCFLPSFLLSECSGLLGLSVSGQPCPRLTAQQLLCCWLKQETAGWFLHWEQSAWSWRGYVCISWEPPTCHMTRNVY